VQPLDDVPIDPLIASLPKADLHRHQEEIARLDRVLARQRGHEPHDWRASARQLLRATPPGLGRIAGIYAPDADLPLNGVPEDDPHCVTAVIADALQDAAVEKAVLVEVRFGAGGMALLRPDFMHLFREAERKVRSRYPRLHAEAIAYLNLTGDPERLSSARRQLEACLRMAKEGLGGIDLRLIPYDREAAPSLWTAAYRLAERAASAGLGITVHAGEFSPANLAAALRVPGLTRIGHGVHAASDPRLMEQLARAGTTLECSLTSNVLLGAVPSYEAHPVRRFVESGIPVTLATDLPVHAATTIGHEYAIAAVLGCSAADLVGFTRNAIQASFTSPERRRALLDGLSSWESPGGMS
jgi:adenosine deaminase